MSFAGKTCALMTWSLPTSSCLHTLLGACASHTLERKMAMHVRRSASQVSNIAVNPIRAYCRPTAPLVDAVRWMNVMSCVRFERASDRWPSRCAREARAWATTAHSGFCVGFPLVNTVRHHHQYICMPPVHSVQAMGLARSGWPWDDLTRCRDGREVRAPQRQRVAVPTLYNARHILGARSTGQLLLVRTCMVVLPQTR